MLAIAVYVLVQQAVALGQPRYVEFSKTVGSLSLVRRGHVAAIQVDSRDWPGVQRAVRDLESDFARVTSHAPTPQGARTTNVAIVVGTIGRSPIIDGLIRRKKIDVTGVRGKWEACLTQVVKDPLPGIERALVIAGSDKRGTIYGVYDLSEQIGVSPWYWWADVPVKHHEAIYLRPGRFVQHSPAVKYRGIFLNDEAPDLTNWVRKNFGNYNHRFYEKVFELLLRLKANYLWPAMWNNCFSEDDPLNPKLADEYGIVMGTSHVEPMMRADKEWNRAGFRSDQWSFDKSPAELTKFWTEGVERNKPYENIITIAMRGKIDTPMSETANISLLERIVSEQRKIIAEHVNPDVTKAPQLWCLYKEVQEYYEKGMRVPDDVTLLWADDNWGDIRRLPTPEERKRSGGAGVYYHFDYVGGPRNYKWINTNPLPKVWEQMNQAYERGANRTWIVNVGSLKPKEFPTEFFLNFAWDPKRWSKEKLGDYTRLWATREFGPRHAAEIADLVEKYAKYNGRRKPELLDPTTFSIVNYGEADRIQGEWDALTAKAESLYEALPAEDRDAFFELVLYQTKAACIVNKLYIAAAKNQLYADQGRASANDYAAQVKELFNADADWTDVWQHKLAKGKWEHFMDQTHIGYTNWQEPPQNNMPAIKEVAVEGPGRMGVAVEGAKSSSLGAPGDLVLPSLDSINRQKRWIEVFNSGSGSVAYRVETKEPWIVVTPNEGSIQKDQRLLVGVNWAAVPQGTSVGLLEIKQVSGPSVSVKVVAHRKPDVRGSAFIENDGVVSIEAEHFTGKVDGLIAHWDKIADYGRTLSGMTVFPVGAATQNSVLLTSQATSKQSRLSGPRLEYSLYLFEGGTVIVQTLHGTTQPFIPGRGMRYGISFDDQPPQVVDIHANYVYMQQAWEKSVADAVRVTTSRHALGPGRHTLKYWAIDAPLVLEKLIVDAGGLRPSYLGPPESARGLERPK